MLHFYAKALLIIAATSMQATIHASTSYEYSEANPLLRFRRQASRKQNYNFNQRTKNQIVNAFNNVRRLIPASDMRKIHWDSELARMAANHASACRDKENFNDKHKRFGYFGQTLFLSSRVNFGLNVINDAIERWNDSSNRKHKQVVWARTFMIGCGATKCPSKNLRGRNTPAILYVCFYGPSGSIFGDAYKAGAPCADCLDPRDSCNRGLCTGRARLTQPKRNVAWGTWGQWNACSRTCGFGGIRNRLRICRPSYVNADCKGTPRQTHFLCAPSTPCVTAPPPRTKPTKRPTSTRWLPWNSWSACSVKCGGGRRTRRRRCSSSRPRACLGLSTESSSCNIQGCGPAERWGPWGKFSSCSASCGGGTLRRTRRCLTRSCSGRASQRRTCNTLTCPPCCTDWSNWSRCSKSCDGGRRRRTRTCRKAPNCPSRIRQAENCNIRACTVVSPVWGNWQSWGSCTLSCGGGYSEAYRRCRAGACKGRNYRKRQCNTQRCRAHRGQSGWGEWVTSRFCSAPCGRGLRSRSRPCKGASGSCTVGIGFTRIPCNTSPCP